MCAIELHDVELPLSFIRQGTLAYAERRYIEAIYQFYFLLETLFSGGHSRKSKVKMEFKKSDRLKTAAEKFLRDMREPFPSADLAKQLTEKYGALNVDSLIDYIIELRGFLHHHTSKRKDIWHPRRQKDYQLDALMMALITNKIGVSLVFEHLDREAVVTEYLRLVKS